MKQLCLTILLLSACGSSAPPREKGKAETVVVETKPGEKPEDAPKVENEARTEKQKRFMRAQDLFSQQAYERAIEDFRFVVYDQTIDEMNYYSATLLMTSLVELKQYDTLCRELIAIDGQLCRFEKSAATQEKTEFCGDLQNARSSCSDTTKKDDGSPK